MYITKAMLDSYIDAIIFSIICIVLLASVVVILLFKFYTFNSKIIGLQKSIEDNLTKKKSSETPKIFIISYGNQSTYLYSALKQIGITPDDSQKKALENYLENNKSEIGFAGR